ELGRRHVVGVIAEGPHPPPAVRALDPGARAAPAAELLRPAVADALGELGLDRLAIPLREGARAGQGAHVDQLGHPVLVEHPDHLVEGAGGVADREDAGAFGGPCSPAGRRHARLPVPLVYRPSRASATGGTALGARVLSTRSCMQPEVSVAPP